MIHFQIHFTFSPSTTALERKESEIQIRSMELCQNQKSLRHEAKQTLSLVCNIQKKGKFPVSLGEPFPEGLRAAEMKDSVGRYVHEFNFIILKGHPLCLDLVFPLN